MKDDACHQENSGSDCALGLSKEEKYFVGGQATGVISKVTLIRNPDGSNFLAEFAPT